MNLIPGVRIFSPVDIFNRIELSSGLISDFFPHKELYAVDAFVPKEPWRTLTTSEQENLIVSQADSTSYSGLIAVVRFPSPLVSAVTVFFDRVSPIETNIDFFEDNAFLLATANIMEFIEENCLLKDEQFEISGYAVNNAFHLPTSTYNTQTNEYTGIHLDDWSNSGLTERESAANRICINFGKEPRYFLFINLTMKQIFDLCSIVDVKEINAVKKHPGILANYFFRKYPDYPAVRIKLNPGEAYIAPTENILHDGSTFGNYNTDINFTIRGFFKPG